MIFVDTHSHLYDEAFDADRDQCLADALQAGVAMLLLPDIDRQSTPRLEALYRQHPDCLLPMAGLHPTSVGPDYEAQLALVHQSLLERKLPYCAVGEIGMDLYWDRTYQAEQTDALLRQTQWAIECNLPVALHIRKAMNEVFAVLRSINRPTYSGVMHCFGGSVQEAHRAVEMGFHLGIGGVVTFKNATLADVVRAIPLENLLLETDAPYLAPVPHRGKRNQSAYIPIIAQYIADLRGISVAQVAEVTTQNAVRLFALPLPSVGSEPCR